MIPADLASRLQSFSLEQQGGTQPAQPIQKITDALSDLEPGQHVNASILGQLPNGAYRALIAQREITLALPFSAKAGDTLELEVVESDGKTTLSVVGNKSADGQAGARQESVATTLSQTGKMIGDLLGGIDGQGKRAAPAALNGNQPLLQAFSGDAAEIAPVLKDALSKSGVFYEAHQARWVAGELPTDQLLKEPQGQHSTLAPGASQATQAGNETAGNRSADAARGNNAATAEQAVASRVQSGQIPAELTPLVQQQLDALATQTYAWQGQIWPGQQMSWEIEEQQERTGGDNPEENSWQTRLALRLPQLGGINANLRLRPGNQVEISLSAENRASETTLAEGASALQQQFAAAGLNLVLLTVKNAAAE